MADYEYTHSTQIPVIQPKRRVRNEGALGVSSAISGTVSAQFGASLGALAFPTIGPIGVVTLRQIISGTILAISVRPKLANLTRADWLLTLLLALAMGSMNTFVYFAIDQIGLGLAITLEFLGPLAIAIAASRRLRDSLLVLAVAIGVVVLVSPGPTTNIFGVSMALIAAASWACYILLNRALSVRTVGVEGVAVATMVGAVIWIPIAVIWFMQRPLTLAAALLALACALLSSALPFSTDSLALRRIPPALFGTLSSFNPVWAALIGVLVLGQFLDPHEWIGMTIIVASNVIITLSTFRKK
ncbi:MAG: EamA family transporter [Canibacter sp.]